MERYIETVVSKKSSFKDYVICFSCCLPLMLIGTYLVMMIYSSTKDFSLTGVACVIAAVLYYISYKIFLLFYIDWEYTFVGDEIRFSKIINKSKRRDIITINIGKVDKIARVNNKEHINSLNSGVEKRYSFISQTTEDYYFMTAVDNEGRRICIFFEPDEKMCDNFKSLLRGKFFE